MGDCTACSDILQSSACSEAEWNFANGLVPSTAGNQPSEAADEPTILENSNGRAN